MTPMPISASNAAAIGAVRTRVSRTSRRQVWATASGRAANAASVVSLAMGPSFKGLSVPARNDEVGHPAQRIGLGAEDVEVTVGLVAKQPRLRARALQPQDGDEGGLARGRIGADRLASLGGIAFGIEQVIDDLEREAEVVR